MRGCPQIIACAFIVYPLGPKLTHRPCSYLGLRPNKPGAAHLPKDLSRPSDEIEETPPPQDLGFNCFGGKTSSLYYALSIDLPRLPSSSPPFSSSRERKQREKEIRRSKMVQRLVYRKRHSYATKSNQTRVVKTPGNVLSKSIQGLGFVKLGFVTDAFQYLQSYRLGSGFKLHAIDSI